MRWRKRLGALVALLMIGATVSACDFDGAYDLPLPGSPVDADDAYEVTAEFEDILNVVPRSPVMVDDVVVGEVTEVERVGWHAKVWLRIRDDIELPANATAEIRQVSLLGEKYVALLEPPTPQGTLSDGDNIPLSATGRNPEVEEVLGALGFLLQGGGVAQLGTITTELNKAMTGRTKELNALLGSLDQFVATIDGQRDDIIRAMESINNLSKTLNSERDTIQDALDVSGPAIEVLADQHDELIEMLAALDRLGTVGTRVINATKDDLLSQLRDLKPVLANLRKAGDQLAPGLNLLVSFPFTKEASEIVLGDYANTSIIFDINLKNFVTPGDGGLPLPDLDNLPIPDLPLSTDGLNTLTKCLTSGSLTSPSCTKVLASTNLLPRLVKMCKTDRNKDRQVCRALNLIGSSPDGVLPGLGDVDLGGTLGLSRLSSALTSGDPTPPADDAGLYGGVTP